MDMVLSNQQTQNQQLTLSPKMLQELKVLQMSNLDLVQYIEEVLTDNPLLEMDEPDEMLDMAIKQSNDKSDEGFDIDESNTTTDFAQYTCMPESLRDHLVCQLGELSISNTGRKIALYIIDNIDADGYLRESLPVMAQVLNASKDNVVKALKLIQNMDPDGVGARNLKECLSIQLKKKGMFDQDILIVIKNYLEPLGAHKYKYISKNSGIPKSRINEIHDIIKQLDPKPGNKFSVSEYGEYINPELIVKEINDTYLIMYMEEKVYSLKINESLQKRLASGDAAPDEQRYIKDRLTKALQVINAIEMRKKTILKAADFIVKYQQDFFKKGYSCLKPLTMRTVAEGIDMHESTVSRTVNGKYIQTPRGVFELRFFFSSKVGEESGNNIAASSAKEAIKKIVSEEDKGKPLSDEQIRKVLEDKGIKVARRTVAKYREELSILPAKMRK